MGILDSHSKINGWAEKFKTGDERAAEKVFNAFTLLSFVMPDHGLMIKKLRPILLKRSFLK
jgi:hypothetical protein